MSAIDRPYPYPVTNSDLIRLHSLQKHFEAGYFAQTVSLESTTSATPSGLRLAALGRKGRSAWGPATVLTGGKEDGTPGKGVDATVIYYLLTPDSYRGKMHMNLHSVNPLDTPESWTC